VRVSHRSPQPWHNIGQAQIIRIGLRCSAFISLAILAIMAPSRTASAQAKEILGWYNDGWNDRSHATYMAHAGLFTEVNPGWYDLGAQNTGVLHIRDGYQKSMVDAVHANGDLVIPTIADDGSNIDTLMNSSAARTNLATAITSEVAAKNYDGIEIDFESGTTAGASNFTAFVRDLRSRLPASKRVEVTVKPPTSNAESQGFFQYKNLAGADAADRIKLMAYDYAPLPIAPSGWVEEVLGYALANIDESKLILGLHSYARIGKVNPAGAETLTTSAGTDIKYDSLPQYEECRTQFETYIMHPGNTSYAEVLCRRPDRRPDPEVVNPYSTWQWHDTGAYMDPGLTVEEAFKNWTDGTGSYYAYTGTGRTVAERIKLVSQYGIAGVAFWTLGREDPQIYSQSNWPQGAGWPAAPINYQQSITVRFEGDGSLLEGDDLPLEASRSTVVAATTWTLFSANDVSKPLDTPAGSKVPLNLGVLKVGDIVVLRNKESGKYLLEVVNGGGATGLGTSLNSATRWQVNGYNCNCSAGDPIYPGAFRVRLLSVASDNHLKRISATSLQTKSGGGGSANWYLDAAP
jgi:spore germination protein YaaH